MPIFTIKQNDPKQIDEDVIKRATETKNTK